MYCTIVQFLKKKNAPICVRINIERMVNNLTDRTGAVFCADQTTEPSVRSGTGLTQAEEEENERKK